MRSTLPPDKPFIFPGGPLPHHDAQAGIALGKGAMRGTYQAGVVHAFILSGYFPNVVAGTSAGCVTGAVLALAAQLESQRRRLDLAAEHIDAWQRNPAERALAALLEGPFGALARDLTDINLTVGELVPLLDDARRG